MTKITDRLLDAYRITTPARAELANVAWLEIPGLLRTLGCELTPEHAATIAAGLAEPESRGQMSTRRIINARGILALAGDRAHAASSHGGVTGMHVSIQAAHEMCVELVGLLGAALSLLDVASRVAAGLD
jgi:hypothetical protein